MADVDLQAKLRELLADPAALSSIMNLVSGLGLSQSSGQPTASQTAQTSQLDFTQPQQPQPNFAQPSNPLLNLGQLSETQPSISTNNIDSSSGVSSAAGTDNTVSSGDDSIPVFARQPNIPRLPVKVGARDQLRSACRAQALPRTQTRRENRHYDQADAADRAYARYAERSELK